MFELPPGCKEYTLPAGSMVKIGDLPYQLKEGVVVIGVAPPKEFPAGDTSDQSIQ